MPLTDYQPSSRRHLSGERHVGIASVPSRWARRAALCGDAKLRTTHVVVGDHDPELRARHEDISAVIKEHPDARV